ncbi:TOBE domain-containing protein, partial [Arthrospira platensis SPKY1]|nr:TOBE domain-containing protein [Arthrospira platensis SPKY1]
MVRIGDFNLTPHPAYQPLLAPYDGKPMLVGIRAENMETLASPADDALRASVLVVEPLGSQNLLTVQLGDNRMKVSTHPDFATHPDADVWLRFPADKI